MQEQRLRTAPSEAQLMTQYRTFTPTTLTITSFYKQESEHLSDQDLLRIIAECRKSSSFQKRLKSISGQLKIDLRSIANPEELGNKLTSSMQRVKPWNNGVVECVKEILELPLRDIYAVNTEIR